MKGAAFITDSIRRDFCVKLESGSRVKMKTIWKYYYLRCYSSVSYFFCYKRETLKAKKKYINNSLKYLFTPLLHKQYIVFSSNASELIRNASQSRHRKVGMAK